MITKEFKQTMTKDVIPTTNRIILKKRQHIIKLIKTRNDLVNYPTHIKSSLKLFRFLNSLVPVDQELVQEMNKLIHSNIKELIHHNKRLMEYKKYSDKIFS